jgi:uncharacterized membrane protein YdjX (TVP38/TMEM64 family)
MPRRRLALLAGLVALTAVALSPHSSAGLEALASRIGTWAPFALLLAWVVLTPALFPRTVFAVTGGVLFGAGPGVALSLAGAVAGAGAAFALARLGRGEDAPRARGRLGALQERVERCGLLAVAALRIAPGVPATLLNHAARLSRSRARSFLGGVALGRGPRVVVCSVGGAGLGAPSPGELALVGRALTALSVAGAALPWAVRRRSVPAAA